jgi:hypothetical protein
MKSKNNRYHVYVFTSISEKIIERQLFTIICGFPGQFPQPGLMLLAAIESNWKTVLPKNEFLP